MFEEWGNHDGTEGSIVLQEFEGKQLRDALHQHSVFELVYILRGSGEWQIGARLGRFSPGALVLCPPGMLHSWRSGVEAGDAGEVCGIVLRFGKETLPKGLLRLPEMGKLRELRERMEQPLRFEVVDRERLRSRLRTVDRAQGVLRMARFYVALELVAGLLASQIVGIERINEELSPRELARVKRLESYLAEHLTEGIGRSDAAREAGMEEAAFSRFFKRAMGTTFVDYLASIRTRHAAKLLGSRRDLSVPEVARMSGFRNLSAFHRQFKRRLGTTPEAYRKAANAEVLVP